MTAGLAVAVYGDRERNVEEPVIEDREEQDGYWTAVGRWYRWNEMVWDRLGAPETAAAEQAWLAKWGAEE